MRTFFSGTPLQTMRPAFLAGNPIQVVRCLAGERVSPAPLKQLYLFYAIQEFKFDTLHFFFES